MATAAPWLPHMGIQASGIWKAQAVSGFGHFLDIPQMPLNIMAKGDSFFFPIGPMRLTIKSSVFGVYRRKCLLIH